jgi:predicted  nucleic acid-binding Zn-ribbon protein
MAVRARNDLKIVDANHQAAETEIMEASKQAAPMVQRFATHRDRIDLAIKELESERYEIISRRDHLRRQAEAVEQGFAVHLDDIEATLKLYEGGLNTVAAQS